MDRDLHSEQPNVGSLRTYRSQSDLTYSYNRAMGIAMIAHHVGHVSLGVARRSGRHAQLGHVIRPTKRCGNCVTARRLLINSAQTFHHTSRWNLSIYVCVCVCVWRQKTRLFAVLPLENRHEIALYRSASQFIFFERCLESRTSLLSSAMAMGSNSCTAPRGIEHYGNWVCRPTTSLRERWRADRLAHAHGQ